MPRKEKHMVRGLILSLQLEESRFEADRITAETRKRGWSVDHVYYEDISIEFSQEGVQFLRQGNPWQLNAYTWCYTRPTHYRGYGGYTDLRTSVLMKLAEHKLRIINGSSFLTWQHFSKIAQYDLFSAAQLPVIPAWHGSNVQFLPPTLKYPFIVKKGLSSMGQGVSLVESQDQLNKLFDQEKIGDYLIQQYVHITEDYRIMVIGGKAVGGIVRKLAKHSILTNISAGGSGEVFVLTPEAKDLAERVARVSGLEHCGVDLLTDDSGKMRVLEVNRLPQFQGFEHVTGMNIASLILDSLDLSL